MNVEFTDSRLNREELQRALAERDRAIGVMIAGYQDLQLEMKQFRSPRVARIAHRISKDTR